VRSALFCLICPLAFSPLSGCSLERQSVPSRGGADAGPECVVSTECSDGIDCTIDRCVMGRCEFNEDDTRCGPGDSCVIGSGCVSGCAEDVCNANLGDPTICQIGMCEGEDCTPVDTCAGMGEGYVCCGQGDCMMCDDGNECTEDSCVVGAGGTPECVNTPLEGVACTDDGNFCNGVEVCSAAGSCDSINAPCPGACDPVENRCMCTIDSDCEAPLLGEWSACMFGPANTAATCSGTRTRTNQIDPRCAGGFCEYQDQIQTEDCDRPSGGTPCGSDALGDWSACTYDGGVCDHSGSRERTVTRFRCNDRGVCRSQSAAPQVDTASCDRDQTGEMCAPDGSPGACTYASTCANSGLRPVPIFRCRSESCNEESEMRAAGCGRNTNGTMCGASMDGTPGPCNPNTPPLVCDQEGERTVPVTHRRCMGGSCRDVDDTRTESCTISGRDGVECMPDETSSCMQTGAGECSTTGEQTLTEYDCSGGSCVSSSSTVSCPYNPAGDACNDDPCVMGQTCDAGGNCTGGTARTCGDEDGIACTVPSCDPVMGCVETPDDGMCPDMDGASCTVPECHPTMGCREVRRNSMCDGSMPCLTGTCNPSASDTQSGTGCVTRADGSDCDRDADACTTDQCNDGVCEFDEMLTCGESDCTPACGGMSDCVCDTAMGCACT